ncbi:hypothetical protein APHAL10511_008381, partial [Amanita phalloides]
MRMFINPPDMAMIQTSVENMLSALDEAAAEAQDDNGAALLPVLQVTSQGMGGRGCIEIDQNWLAYASQVQSLHAIADELGIHLRTVQCRLLDYGLAEQAPPVIQLIEHQDGTQTKQWQPTGPTMSSINSNPDALDVLVGSILQVFPDYGVEYLQGAVHSRVIGYRSSAFG